MHVSYQVGDKRKFNVALVTLKAKGATGELPGGEELDGDAASLVPGVTTIKEAAASQAFIEHIRQVRVCAHTLTRDCVFTSTSNV